jgi:hypothetical protein
VDPVDQYIQQRDLVLKFLTSTPALATRVRRYFVLEASWFTRLDNAERAFAQTVRKMKAEGDLVEVFLDKRTYYSLPTPEEV